MKAPLSKQKIRELKSQAHHLDPVILMGANGLTDAVHAEIERALFDHELIKIKLSSKDKDEKAKLTQAILDHHHATLIAKIGHVIAIYAPSDKFSKDQ